MKLPYEIIKTVADHEGIPVTLMLKNDRHRRCKDARQKAMYFLRILTKLTLAEIGHNFEGKFGIKDHATVLHAIKTVNNLMETDEIYAESMDMLSQEFGLKEKNVVTKQIDLLEFYNANAETSMPVIYDLRQPKRKTGITIIEGSKVAEMPFMARNNRKINESPMCGAYNGYKLNTN